MLCVGWVASMDPMGLGERYFPWLDLGLGLVLSEDCVGCYWWDHHVPQGEVLVSGWGMSGGLCGPTFPPSSHRYWGRGKQRRDRHWCLSLSGLGQRLQWMVGHSIMWAFRWPHRAPGEFILFFCKTLDLFHLLYFFFKTSEDIWLVWLY